MRSHPFIVFSLAGLLCLLQACTGLQDEPGRYRIFRGDAGFDKLPHAVRTSPLVTYCTPSSVETADYTARQFPARAQPGRETRQLVERVQGIASASVSGAGQRHWGLPGIDDWSGSGGRAVTCGGFMLLAFSEREAGAAGAPACEGPASRRFAMTQVSEYTGTLFPLRVGNELSFTYDALYRAWSGQAGCQDRRLRTRAQFTVLGVNDAFSINGRRVPGRVYLLERTLIDANSGETSRQDYYYSDALNWVVMEVEYRNGTPGLVREIVDWQPGGWR